MSTLILPRGLPASGKTTWSMERVAAGPNVARSNRDDLRASMFGGHGVLPWATEERITAIQRDSVRGLLRTGWSVVVDDMNVRLKYARAWADLAAAEGAELEVVDFEVPLATLLERDAARIAAGQRGVGEAVIRDLYARFCGRPWPTVTPTETAATLASTYVPDETRPPAWLVDIDGTLARMIEGGRGPYDWHRVSEDEPHAPVVELVRALATGPTYADHDTTIVVMSGRDASCRADTLAWLDKHGVPVDALFMRPVGDQRKDSIVKAELFREHVAPKWNVRGVLDDRDQVVEMWRSMGLMCAQVAPGAF